MAQTVDQWYDKITKFVPSWYFQDADLSVCFSRGVFMAIAAVFQQIQQDCDDMVQQTYIVANPTAPLIDLHGF